MMRSTMALALLVLAGCAPVDESFCAAMARRCGGAHAESWQAWCESPCVPEHARSVSCDANAQCLLCDAPRDDGQTTYFGLPGDEIEYMWTQLDALDEPVHPPTEPAPTGSSFHDGPGDFVASGHHYGVWEPIEPYEGVVLGEPAGFCEPGPNQFVRANVASEEEGLVLRAERMPPELFDTYCDYPNCPWGPYRDCGGPPLGLCPYGDAPETSGVGSASQADRTMGTSSEQPTYGYGHYRAVLRAGEEGTGPQPGFVYAFFTQSNQYCEGAAPNLETNTSEIDLEISSGPGRAEALPFCDESEMCFQVSTWVSSTQGIGNGERGRQRHEVSGFRFHDRATADSFRTYGWDWRPDEVRFTYDADPDDCDERSGACAPAQASVAICRHDRFVPRRPSPMHVQLWNARWAGRSAPGTRAALTVHDVWHEAR